MVRQAARPQDPDWPYVSTTPQQYRHTRPRRAAAPAAPAGFAAGWAAEVRFTGLPQNSQVEPVL